MTFSVDAEVLAAIGALVGDEPPPPPAIGDWAAIREAVAALYPVLTGPLPTAAQLSVTHTTRTVVTDDGYALLLHLFIPEGQLPGAAVLHAHGGGMIAGAVELFAPFIADYAAASGMPFVSVDYRLFPEATGQQAAHDFFTGLRWLHENADEFGVDTNRIAVMGESAGGGLAASAAIQARDSGTPVAKQILIYPMLDDRTTVADPHLEAIATWPYTNNITAWDAVLGADRGSDHVSPLIAPARLTNHAGLAPAYIEVGELDIFRDEDCKYAGALWAAGVSAELHVLPALVHGWDQFAPTSTVRNRVMTERIRTLRAI